MNRYPTREGIAISPYELDLPDSRVKDFNNHHNEWPRRVMARSAITYALRDLSRHQYVMPKDVHNWIHDTYEPPEVPTDEQAAREVIEAYEMGEMFKRYDKGYRLDEIPKEFVDALVAKYSLIRIFDMSKGRQLRTVEAPLAS